MKAKRRWCVSRAGNRACRAGWKTLPRSRATGRLCISVRLGNWRRHAGGGGGLYRYDTLTHTTTYIAPNPGYLAPLYKGNGVAERTWYESSVARGAYAALDVRASYYATGNGEFLVFDSSANLTGYESGGKPGALPLPLRTGIALRWQYRVRVV